MKCPICLTKFILFKHGLEDMEDGNYKFIKEEKDEFETMGTSGKGFFFRGCFENRYDIDPIVDKCMLQNLTFPMVKLKNCMHSLCMDCVINLRHKHKMEDFPLMIKRLPCTFRIKCPICRTINEKYLTVSIKNEIVYHLEFDIKNYELRQHHDIIDVLETNFASVTNINGVTIYKDKPEANKLNYDATTTDEITNAAEDVNGNEDENGPRRRVYRNMQLRSMRRQPVYFNRRIRRPNASSSSSTSSVSASTSTSSVSASTPSVPVSFTVKGVLFEDFVACLKQKKFLEQ